MLMQPTIKCVLINVKLKDGFAPHGNSSVAVKMVISKMHLLQHLQQTTLIPVLFF